jgi:hypothetical protein
MQVYLLNCKFGDALSRRLGLNMLNMCMMILEELQKTYSVASVCRGIFGKAIQQLFPDDAASVSLTHSLPEQQQPQQQQQQQLLLQGGTSSASSSSSLAVAEQQQPLPPVTATVTDPSLQLELFSVNATKADFIDALTAEASIFSFVDMLNFA